MEKKKRGNQGWSTKGRDGSPGAGNQGWSTAPGAGRPKSPGPARTNRTIRATDDEYKLIKSFIAIVRDKPDEAKKMLDNLIFGDFSKSDEPAKIFDFPKNKK